ncbi:MAG: triose-phosphate isomerase [Coriobacteriales bacterium]|jgi:triosephosphate isomerase|nr:triose-phosphate isomerase [Coriobacteriales bacterium]
MGKARRPLVAGNWKMHKTTAEATDLSQRVSYEYSQDYDGVDVVLCPPFTDLRSVRVVLGFDRSDIQLGAQDVYWEDAGAFTGAISPVMLKELGCAYCIVGHSERRERFGETDATVNAKVRALIAHRITPIVCCGESLAVREEGRALEFATAQVRAALDGTPADASVVVAYEPIWSIGTGHTPTPEQADEVCAAIRAAVAQLHGHDAAEKTRVLYGGSMKPANVAQFAPMPHIDGGLIGAAALDAFDFIHIVKAFAC